jgi:Domain of unknown function (DUF4184)
MPFTISHAAAVLPFSRPLARWRLLSAAVIGSMVPDFGWFSPWRPARFETHSLDALVTFCLPVGLATYWLFQWLIRTPLLELLPPGAYSRWSQRAEPADYTSVRQWILAACGVLVGAVTHLVLDAFTHEGARGVRMIPALEDPVVEISGHRVGGAHLLQDASSLIGLIVVIAFLAYGLRPGRANESAPGPRRLQSGERRLWTAAYVLVGAALSTMFFFAKQHHPPSVNASLVPISTTAIAVLRGLAAALVGVSVLLTWRLRRHAR